MGDVEDMIEEGEIEDDVQEEIYKKIDRPQLEVALTDARTNYNSDSSTGSDSDNAIPRKKLSQKPPSHTAPLSKNGSLWKNMLQEESLMENLKTCDVSASRKRKYERGAESYDFEAHRTQQKSVDTEGARFSKRCKVENGNESSSSSSSFKRKSRKKHAKKKKILPDILEENCDDETFGRKMAQNLEEEKCDLIVRTVSVIGKEASLSIYKITQKIEREGGMLTMNKNRRRTPGGVFLFLLKTSDKIDEETKHKIFDFDKKRNVNIADRKLSSDLTEAKDPPNSPANSELVDPNNKVTDAALVSKILDLDQHDDDDLLEINYNMDF